MIEPSGLLNKKVLVPRGTKQAKSFSQLVEKHGGIPVEIPLIAFRPMEKNSQIVETLNHLPTYEWIIFTSKVTVETFFSFINIEELKCFPKIAVIGKKLEEALLEKGFKVDFVPSAYVAEVFAEEFLPFIAEGTKVLLPKGNLAREYIASTLNQHGAHVDEIIIYETFMPEESCGKLANMLRENELDILLFTSPSTVDHLLSVVHEYHLEEHLSRCVFGCIGPVTEKKLIEYGLPVHASPEIYTVKDMIKSTIDFLDKSNLEVK